MSSWNSSLHQQVVDSTIAGLVLYPLLLVYIFSLYLWLFSIDCFRKIWYIVKIGIPWRSPVTIFHILILLFIICRITWLYLQEWGSEPESTIFLDLTFLVLFSAFSALLFHWVDLFLVAIISRYKASRYLSQRERFFYLWPMRWLWITTNVSVYLVQIGLWIGVFTQVDFSGPTHHESGLESNPIFLANIMFILGVFGLVGILFAIFTIIMIVLLLRKQPLHLIRILGEAILLIISLGIKIFCYLFHPISTEYLPEPVWYVLAFYITELVVVPVFVTMEIIDRRRKIVRMLDLGEAMMALSNPLDTPLMTGDGEGESSGWLIGDSEDSLHSGSATPAYLSVEKEYIALGLQAEDLQTNVRGE